MFDLAIIGGGVNGCGIAREAALRGASVYLCEMNGLASATSSASTKLIHGGLRYLEHYEFRLVREALSEREVLWQMAPHIIRPRRFVLPHHKGLRPAWMLRLGLFLYDHIGGRKRLPPTRRIDLSQSDIGAPLKAGQYKLGFEYSDCSVDDSRLVFLNAIDAREHGAIIETQTQAITIERQGEVWHCTVENRLTGERKQIKARALVNAAGPWVAKVLDTLKDATQAAHVRLVQGSHIVVPKLYNHDLCYIFQNADGRIIFAIPYEHDFTLIGTTDRDYHDDPAKVEINSAEIDYLCDAASEYFAMPITRDQIVWCYCGVRSLYDDGASQAQQATRDYVLDLDVAQDLALLSVYGGKITTYRRLALHALEKLSPYLPPAFKRDWTRIVALPGGDFSIDGFGQLKADVKNKYPWLDGADLERLTHNYGTRVYRLLGEASGYQALGTHFGAGLYQREVIYLVHFEYAHSAADIAWRHTKLGLLLTEEQLTKLDTFLSEHRKNRLEGDDG